MKMVTSHCESEKKDKLRELKMTRGMGVGEQKLEKQMGCMAGFFNIFDRNQILSGKRIYSVKRLPPATTPPETTHSGSLEESKPETESKTENETTEPEKTPLPLPVFDFKEGTRSPWKFSREAPRLSLDSRAVVDAKGTIHPKEEEKRRRSTSVVAKLMGLELDSVHSDPELRRSASESRVPRDLPLPSQQQQQQYRFFDTNNFQLKNFDSTGPLNQNRVSDPKTESVKGIVIRQKKSFYDSADIFPGPKQSQNHSVSVSVQGEIERRLKMRGIHEPSKDLDTLKQILEALQLRGLLHSKKAMPVINHRNFVFHNGNDSPIVVMKPGRSSNRYTGNDSPPPASTFRLSPRGTDRNARVQAQIQPQVRGRNANSPTRSPNRVRKTTTTNVETQRKVNVDGVDRRRVNPVHSNGLNSRNGPDREVPSRSPRMRRATTYQKQEKTVAEDELSTVSDSSFSASSHTDTEVQRRFNLKVEDQYREGKELLQRCDKLLNSIAEITTTTGTDQLQPSPVSVLDSSFYKDESSCSPSPVMKRCIDYKESEDDAWSAALCCSESKSDDCDFVYVLEVLRASHCLPEDSDVFLLLEQQQYLKGNDTSKVSTLQRRLIFDIVHEILNRNQRLPPWKVENTPSLQRIWSEFRRIREREESEDLFQVICQVLKKDIDAVNDWGEFPVEMGDVVLDIERYIFKDLIVETIQNLASSKGHRNRVSALRRKLEF